MVQEGKNGYSFSPTDAQGAIHVLDAFLQLSALQQKEMGSYSKRLIEVFHGSVYQQAVKNIVSFIQHQGNKTLYFRSLRSWFLLAISKNVA